MGHRFDRRVFLGGSAGAFGAAALSGPLAFLHTKNARASIAAANGLCGTRGPSPYGPLYPAPDRATGLELILLPHGFRYTTFSWTGDMMSDGNIVPEDHDEWPWSRRRDPETAMRVASLARDLRRSS